MQPLETKKFAQPLGTEKNHANSWDKKITHNLGTKKRATSWDNISLQPLGTKKNHSKSWDKKMQPRDK